MPFLSCVALCFFCSIPFGLLVSMMMFDRDPRLYHSKNIGMSNVWRTSGSFAGLFTLFLDMSKAIVSLTLCQHFFTPSTVLKLGFACVFFHCYSIFLQLNGGKGVATAAGVLLFFNPTLCFYGGLVWIGLWIMTQKASVASLGAAVLTVVLAWYERPTFFYVVLAMTLLIVWRHKQNIFRILEKEEHSF